MFLHYHGLQDDSQSLCTATVQKKKKVVTDLLLFCSATSQQLLLISVLPSLNNMHVFKNLCKAVALRGDFCLFYVPTPCSKCHQQHVEWRVTPPPSVKMRRRRKDLLHRTQ